MCKVLFLTRYGQLGASSRMRFFNYIPILEAAGIKVTVNYLITDKMISAKYSKGKFSLLSLLRSYLLRVCYLIVANCYDVIFIEKEVFPNFPIWFERFFLRNSKIIMDFDDAIYLNYKESKITLIKKLLENRIETLISKADAVTAGNLFHMGFSKACGCNNSFFIPTVVDINKYQKFKKNFFDSNITKWDSNSSMKIVWIGSPATIGYLKELQEVFQKLAQKHSIILRVIGVHSYTIEGVNTECFAWSDDTEAKLIGECDVGIMPIKDTPWEQGKCGYKLIQYMACGLPVICSPVGANAYIVDENLSGLYASTKDEWFEKLQFFILNPALKTVFGNNGFARVEKEFCYTVTAPKIINIIKELSGQKCAE